MEIRKIEPEDLDAVLDVERTAWGESAATRQSVVARAAAFHEGSIVAVLNGQIVGYAAAQLTDKISTGTWAEQTDDGNISNTHVPDGRLAYGVSMSALPGISGEGVAHHVVAHYADIFLTSGRCSALCLGSRLPGYARWVRLPDTSGNLDDYVKLQHNGRVRDPELRLYASNGFDVLWSLPGYFPDAASLDHGAMVVRTAA